MFCEIEVDHGGPVQADGLKTVLRQIFTTEINPVQNSYALTQLFQRQSPIPDALFAFHRHDSVVILLSVSNRGSRYHLEGQGSIFSMEKLYQTAEGFARELLVELKKIPESTTYRVKECRAEVKQNLGEDTRIAGRLLTLGPWMKESLDWKQLWGSFGTFVTALALLWAGLKQDPIKAAGISFGVAILFKCTEAGAGYLWNGGKMNWKIRS